MEGEQIEEEEDEEEEEEYDPDVVSLIPLRPTVTNSSHKK